MCSFEGKGFSFPLGARTYIMGILNVTPDSFSDGGLYFDAEAAARRAVQMQDEGADIIDIGAMSTRPGHEEVSPDEEIRRLSGVFDGLDGKLGIPVSVDTYNVRTAEFALSRGAAVINDVSGVFSESMAEVILRYGAGWVVMHTGSGDADREVRYDDVADDVRRFFTDFLGKSEAFGIPKQRLCLDVGFGFGKSYEDNIKLLADMRKTRIDGVALMAALSRKRMVGEATGRPVNDRLEGTIAADTLAVCNGADIIRVHDVREHVSAAKMADAVLRRI